MNLPCSILTLPMLEKPVTENKYLILDHFAVVVAQPAFVQIVFFSKCIQPQCYCVCVCVCGFWFVCLAFFNFFFFLLINKGIQKPFIKLLNDNTCYYYYWSSQYMYVEGGKGTQF